MNSETEATYLSNTNAMTMRSWIVTGGMVKKDCAFDSGRRFLINESKRNG